VERLIFSETIAFSTPDQDLDKNKADILHFANEKNFGKIEWVEETFSGAKSWKDRKISGLVDELNKDDSIITSELTRLGRL